MASGWGKRLASSFLLALGAATATWFGIGFGLAVSPAIFSLAQQMAGTGAMFFFVFGAGMAADTADAIKEATK
jgi:hypothetical protein